MIYTSYFAKLKSLPESVIPISICAKPPAFYKGLQYKKLAPTYDILMQWKKDHDDAAYIQKYEALLSNLDVNVVLKEFAALLPPDIKKCDIALICYEKPTDFCHRHLVAKWLNKNLHKCEEYDFTKEQQFNHEQMELDSPEH